MKIFTASQISEIENRCVEFGIGFSRLMENAGAAAARAIRDRMDINGKNTVVVCGTGNNGGDGYVVARMIREHGGRVSIIMSNGLPRTETAMDMYLRCKDLGIRMTDFSNDEQRALALIDDADIIVDGIFGTGFHGQMQEQASCLARAINQADAFVVSLDLPSGAACDTGAAATDTIKADLTVAFIGMKYCHILKPSAEFAGDVIVEDIGVPDAISDEFDSFIFTIEEDDIAPAFGKRNMFCHKGDFGKAAIICGSKGMAGASYFAAKAAVTCGTGLVRSIVPENIYGILAGMLPEAVFAPVCPNDEGKISGDESDTVVELVNQSDACLVGCGLGVCEDTKKIVESLMMQSKVPVVVDADGINIIAQNINILKNSQCDVVLTPHPGEMARLCGITIDEVEKDRIGIARAFSMEYGCVLVLKGARTLVVSKSGAVAVNVCGNGGMATAGSGDMLAGMIVSMIAQGATPFAASCAAVYLHAKAGDAAANAYSQRAMTPANMIEALPDIFLNYEQR